MDHSYFLGKLGGVAYGMNEKQVRMVDVYGVRELREGGLLRLAQETWGTSNPIFHWLLSSFFGK